MRYSPNCVESAFPFLSTLALLQLILRTQDLIVALHELYAEILR